MDTEEKLFNIIKLGCTLLYNDTILYPRAFDLNHYRMLLTKAQTHDKLYITYKSNDLLTFIYGKDTKTFVCRNSIHDDIKVDKEILSMDLTQFNLSYGRLNDFIIGTICGFLSFMMRL